MSDDADRADPLSVEERLRALDSLPVDEHVAIYDGLHRELQDQLVGAPDGSDSADGARESHSTDGARGSESASGAHESDSADGARGSDPADGALGSDSAVGAAESDSSDAGVAPRRSF